jgi:hypothetical protein
MVVPIPNVIFVLLSGVKWDKMALALIIILNKSIQKVNA